MSERLRFSQGRLNRVVARAKAYWPYVFGEAPPSGDGEAETAAQQKRYEEEKIGRGFDTTMVPMHGILRQVVAPYLISKSPIWNNQQRKGADALEVARVKLYEELAGCIYRENDQGAEHQLQLDDAFFYGVGWMETDFNDTMVIPRHQWIDARRVLVDCETTSPRPRDQRWQAIKTNIPIETARGLAETLWDAKKYEFNPVDYHWPSDADKDPFAEAWEDESQQILDETPTDFVRIVRVFVKGANPWTTSARAKRRSMSDPIGLDDVYTGKDHILILEARNGYDNFDAYQLVGVIDAFPFPCDPGETPLTPMRITKDNRSFYPPSIFQSGHSLQVSANKALRDWNTDAHASARRVVGYNEHAFQTPVEAEAALYGQDALLTVKMSNGADLDRAVQVKNFGAPNPSLEKGMELNIGQYRTVTGLQAFELQPRANRTALDASIQNEGAQVRLQSMGDMAEAAINTVVRKGIQCARWNMTSDDLALWLKLPVEVDGAQVARPIIGPGGKSETVNDLWPNDPKPEDVRREVEINLEPRSVQFSNPDKEVQNMLLVQKHQLELIRAVGDTAKAGAPETARGIAAAGNAMVEAMCRTLNIPNYERFLVDVGSIIGPTEDALEAERMAQEQAMQQQQAAMEMQQMMGAGGPNPQQQAAATRMMNQGVNPEAIPTEAGGAG